MITHQVEVNNRNPRVKKSMREKLEASQKTHSDPKKPPTIHRVPEHIRKGDESAYQPQIISIGPYHHRVPEHIRKGDESAYQPQIISIGPYHRRVPEHIRKGDESAYHYQPQIISIDPYHRSEKGLQLQAMENHKWRYLQDFLSRNKKICLERCLEEIQSLEESVRNCYSETIDLESEELVEMMVLDGCFIIELFLKKYENTESDPIFNTRWMLPVISHDMLLLENQLPFFILERLFELIDTSNSDCRTSLGGLALDFFRRPLFWKIKTPHFIEIHHLLHLLHSSLLPDSNSSNHSRDASVKSSFRKWKNSSKHLNHIPSTCSASSELSNDALSSPRPPPPPPKSNTCAIDIQGTRENLKKDDPTIGLGANKWGGLAQLLVKINIVRVMLSLRASSPPQPQPQPPKSIPGATELHGAGVKFKTKTKKEAESFLEVKFSDGVMQIPHLLIDCNTNSLFRNFIAFEQCYPKSETHFTIYAFFMDCIVNTAKDVALLGQHKIIEHWLGNDEAVALLFNRLCCGIAIDTQSSYLSGLFNEVTKYCKTSWHRWRACLMRDYFSNPWAIISVVAAVVILLIGIVQTFLAFISYLRPT